MQSPFSISACTHDPVEMIAIKVSVSDPHSAVMSTAVTSNITTSAPKNAELRISSRNDKHRQGQMTKLGPIGANSALNFAHKSVRRSRKLIQDRLAQLREKKQAEI
jgi:hypothetical protein